MARVHIVGAGLAGLAAAVRLARAGFLVTVYEAAGHAGGRCRSFHDTVLDTVIDNGNHLLLSGNLSAMAYLTEIGAADSLEGPSEALFPFFDVGSGDRWTLRPNRGPIPWWLWSASRRPAGTKARDFLPVLRLPTASADATVDALLNRPGKLYSRFWEPLCVAVMNTPAATAAVRPLWQAMRETFLHGAAACLPRIARQGLSASFVDPALAVLQESGADIRFNHRLRSLEYRNGSVSRLDFGGNAVVVQPGDNVVLALPPPAAHSVLPQIAVPVESHAIVNAHFRLGSPVQPPGGVPLLGLVGGVAHWIFLRGDIASVTVSAADTLADEASDRLGKRIWRDVAAALGLSPETPPCRIVKERRATFAQTPAAQRLRHPTRGEIPNLFFAGDWTDTGLPATIESAVRSGHAAAQAVTETAGLTATHRK